MSTLKIFSDTSPKAVEVITSHSAISDALAAIEVRFERWQANRILDKNTPQNEIIDAYRDSVDRLMREYGFKSVDVISVKPDHPDKKALRAKFLAEHIHTDFEVRFFVEGRGLFYIHAGDKVYGIFCEQGDLISVPARARHWFDMGEEPDLKCIRLFTTPEGWVADYTGSDIAKQFPTVEVF